MSWLPATGELLGVAREVLRERVMPRLDGEGRYEAAMIANALAVAIREVELGAGVRAREQAQLAEFYQSADDLEGLRRRLCRDLRSGAIADGRAVELRALLERLVRARLAISNPDYRG